MIKRLFIIFVAIIMSGCFGTAYHAGPSRHNREIRYTRVERYEHSPIRIIPVVIDNNFSEQDKIEIDNSLGIWNYVFNGYISLRVESFKFNMEKDIIESILKQDGIIILKINRDNPLISNEKYNKELTVANNINNDKITLAFANDIGGNKIWVVRDRIKDIDVFPIMLHELGHIFGVNHTKTNENSLMYPYYLRENYLCVDYYTMSQAAIYESLPIPRLNFCQ